MNRGLRKLLFTFLLIFLISTDLWPQTFSDAGISLPQVSYSSVSRGDYNNDGYLDILLTGFTGTNYISKVFSNNGNGTFTEQTGIILEPVYKGSVAWGDYDNDGDLDILLTGYAISIYGPVSKVYRNNGNNTFTEQTNIVLPGVYTGSCAWGDYDNDGDLDILMAGNKGSTYITSIYRNNGDNSFEEQTGISLPGVYSGSADWGDYDRDGYLDILLTGNTSSGEISRVYPRFIFCNHWQ